jgi:transcriptional regulator with XRE-family HTH domain
MEFNFMSNSEIQKELGRRLQRERLNQNLTQAELTEKSGISRRTLTSAENGEGPTMDTMICILRGLGVLSRLDQFLPEPPMSPVQLAKLRGNQRQRASRKRTVNSWTANPQPGDEHHEKQHARFPQKHEVKKKPSTPWTWNE